MGSILFEGQRLCEKVKKQHKHTYLIRNEDIKYPSEVIAPLASNVHCGPWVGLSTETTTRRARKRERYQHCQTKIQPEIPSTDLDSHTKKKKEKEIEKRRINTLQKTKQEQEMKNDEPKFPQVATRVISNCV